MGEIRRERDEIARLRDPDGGIKGKGREGRLGYWLEPGGWHSTGHATHTDRVPTDGCRRTARTGRARGLKHSDGRGDYLSRKGGKELGSIRTERQQTTREGPGSISGALPSAQPFAEKAAREDDERTGGFGHTSLFEREHAPPCSLTDLVPVPVLD